jgi:hypothetical protein
MQLFWEIRTQETPESSTGWSNNQHPTPRLLYNSNTSVFDALEPVETTAIESLNNLLFFAIVEQQFSHPS